MSHRFFLLLAALSLLLTGCPPDVERDDDDSAKADDDDVVDDDDAVDDDDSGPDMPPNPAPLSLTFGGPIGETLVFDTPACTHLSETEFSAFWRGADHNVLLMVQMMGGSYSGPGDYDVDGSAVRVKLQTESGGSYDFFYQVDDDEGDTGTVTIDWIGDEAWGEFTFSGMHGADGVIDATPMPVPIWCDMVQT